MVVFEVVVEYQHRCSVEDAASAFSLLKIILNVMNVFPRIFQHPIRAVYQKYPGNFLNIYKHWSQETMSSD